jgi:hypothetical protein
MALRLSTLHQERFANSKQSHFGPIAAFREIGVNAVRTRQFIEALEELAPAMCWRESGRQRAPLDYRNHLPA